MKRILILLLGLFSVAYGQFSPTSAKSAFKWGVSIGTRDSTAYAANDSLVVVINRQGRMMYRSTDGYWKLLSNVGANDYVPYNGANANVFLGSNRIKADAFDLGIPSSSTDSIGRMRWNADDLTMNIGLTSSVVLQSGQEMLILVKNQTGVTIPNGTVVRQSGVVGASGRLKVEPFLANGTHNSNQVLGLTTEDIPNGGDGFVSYFGKVRGLNTAAYPDSTILYASPTVAGGLTNVVPEAPNNIVKIGTVVKSAASNGIIFARVVAGSNINQDEGVELTNPLNNSLLVYDSLTTLWKDKTLVEIGAVRVQDTAAMLNPYLRKSDTAAMLSPFVQYSDTANMLSPYRRTSTLIQQSEVAGLSTSLAAKLNISDTATMLSPYRRTSTKITNSDLVNSTISGVALGSNLNNLSAGNGLSGTAYNGSAAQTWQVDTSTISTKANVTGLLVGYATTGSVAAKLNISDTATMLSNYRRKTTLIENADLRNSAITINGSSTALGGSISVGTVTSVAASAGTGISVSGSPITGSGTLTITNTAPDQTVTLTAGTGISVSGTYPNFTVTNSSPSSGGTVTSVSAGTGMSFTTITSSGAVNADTTVLATRAYAAGLDVAKANTSLNNVNGVLSSTYGGAGSVSGLLKANGSGVVSAAVNNSDYTLLNGTGFVRMSGTTPSYITGTSSQFVKADGSLDGTSYATAASLSGYLPLSGGTLTGALASSSTGKFGASGSITGGFVLEAIGNLRVSGVIAGSGNLRLYGNSATSTNYLEVAENGSVTAQNTLNGTSLSMSGGANLATSSGNVGIGTASPTRKLGITVSPTTTGDDGIILSNGSSDFLFTRTGATYSYRGVSGNAGMIYTSSGINLSLLSDGGFTSFHNSAVGEIGRWATDGTFLINTTTTDGTNKLIVNGGVKGTTGEYSQTLRTTGTSTPASGAGIEFRYTSNTGFILAYDRSASQYKPVNISDGALVVTNGSGISVTGAATFSSSVTATTGTFDYTAINGGASVIAKNGATSGQYTNAGYQIWAYNGTSVTLGAAFGQTASTFSYQQVVGNQTSLYGYQSGGLRIATANAPIIFSSGASDPDFSTERMRITSGGNLLIGTTTDNGARLQVSGNTSTSQLITGSFNPNMILRNTATTLSSLYTTVIANGGSNYTYTLDAASGHNRIYIIRAYGSGTSITLNRSGSDVIVDNAGNNQTSLTITPSGGAVWVQSNGSDAYIQLK